MLDSNNLDKMLMLASKEDLARIVWQTAQHHPVAMTVAILHATFLSTRDDAVLIEAVCEAATVEDHVPYTEADAYCQIIDEIAVLVKRTADSGNLALAIRLAETALHAGEISAEQIMDGDYWQMSLEGLLELSQSLKKNHLAIPNRT